MVLSKPVKNNKMDLIQHDHFSTCSYTYASDNVHEATRTDRALTQPSVDATLMKQVHARKKSHQLAIHKY